MIIQNKSAEKTIIRSLNRYSGFIVYDNSVYYLDINNNLAIPETGKQARLQKRLIFLLAYVIHIYYISNKSLYRVNMEGKNPEKLAVLSTDSYDLLPEQGHTAS